MDPEAEKVIMREGFLGKKISALDVSQKVKYGGSISEVTFVYIGKQAEHILPVFHCQESSLKFCVSFPCGVMVITVKDLEDNIKEILPFSDVMVNDQSLDSFLSEVLDV